MTVLSTVSRYRILDLITPSPPAGEGWGEGDMHLRFGAPSVPISLAQQKPVL